MRARGDQLGDGVGEGRIWVDVEDRDGVATLFHAALGEDHGDEVHTGGLQQGHGGSRGEEARISGGDVSDDVETVVDHGEGRQPFVGHQHEGFGEGCVGTTRLLADDAHSLVMFEGEMRT